MRQQIEWLHKKFQTILSGEPWYGRPVYILLQEVDSKKALRKPDSSSHSMIELLYHLITWADFTLKRMEEDRVHDLAYSEALDWRAIDPAVHTWKDGVASFKAINTRMMKILKTKDDAWLSTKVDYRKYDFRFLLEGILDHHIYHIGQIAYLHKMEY